MVIEREKELLQSKDKISSSATNPLTSFEEREKNILQRIQKYYSLKLGREISYKETKEIADNLLNFAKAIYGT